MPDLLIHWAIRITLALLTFVVVLAGLPWLLALGGVHFPDNVVTLIAVLLALLVLAGHYYRWPRPVAP